MKNSLKKNCKSVLTTAALMAMSGTASFGQTAPWELGGNSISDPDTEFIGTLSDFPFRIWTAGTERMVVDQNGLVGIGTMYPTVNLDIFGEEKQQLFIRSSSADALLRLHAVGNYVDIYNPISTSGDLRFGFNGTDRVTFTSTGNVGIGETNPNSKLYVLSADDIGTTNFVQFLAANKTQGIGIGFNSINAIGSNTNQDIIISPKGTGKVGIGTNSPGSKLSVNGETSIGSSYATTAAPTNGMIVEGNTGVGMTTFPQTSKLAVNGGSGTGIYAEGVLHGVYAAGRDYAIEASANGVSSVSTVTGISGSASGASGAPSYHIGVLGTAGGTPSYNYGVKGSAGTAGTRSAGIYGEQVSFGPTYYFAGFFEGDVAIYHSGGTYGKLSVGASTSGSNRLNISGSAGIGGSSYTSTAAPTNGLIVEGDVGIGTNSPGYQLELSTDDAAKLTTATWTTTSDKTLKKDIKDFELGLSVLRKIRPVTYKYNGEGGIEVSDKVHVGIIAQEIQEIPELAIHTISKIKKGRLEGRLSYNANAIIYVLINAVNELSSELEEIKRTCASSTEFNKIEPNTTANSYAVQNQIYQNRPNPSDGNTIIDYEFHNGEIAEIMVFDLSGLLVRSFKGLEKGKGSLRLQQSGFRPGLYNYALLVDGQLVDTKKMVIN